MKGISPRLPAIHTFSLPRRSAYRLSLTIIYNRLLQFQIAPLLDKRFTSWMRVCVATLPVDAQDSTWPAPLIPNAPET